MSGFASEKYADDVLDLWARGMGAPEIAAKVGDPLTADRVSHIVKYHRRRGDPRATAKRPGGFKSPPASVWTAEKRDHLVTLMTDGFSIRSAAAEMGLTVGQVNGFVSRNPGLFEGRVAAKRPRPSRPAKKSSGGFVDTGFRRRKVVQPKTVDVEDAKAIHGQIADLMAEVTMPERIIGIMDLDETTCRFPVGDPLASNFTFCGAPPARGKVYCLVHHRIAYVASGGG